MVGFRSYGPAKIAFASIRYILALIESVRRLYTEPGNRLKSFKQEADPTQHGHRIAIYRIPGKGRNQFFISRR
jgi:hypothetical protein